MRVLALRSPGQHAHSTTVGMLPRWSLPVVDVTYPVCRTSRVRYSKVKHRSAGGSAVNAYIILSKYKTIRIFGEEVILCEP